MILAETVGPYTIGLALVLLIGFPLTARYLKRSASFEAGPLKATLGEIKQDAKRAAEAAAVVGESVGSINGSGSIQSQLAEMRERVEREAIAQERIEEATANVQHMLSKVFEWQSLHSEEDMATFRQLNEAVTFLRGLIGEPGEGDLEEPLIPYIHRVRHEMANRQTVDRMTVELQHQTLMDAMAMLKEMRARIEDAAGLAAGVAADLAESQHRADEVIDGEPGEAADAGAQSGDE